MGAMDKLYCYPGQSAPYATGLSESGPGIFRFPYLGCDWTLKSGTDRGGASTPEHQALLPSDSVEGYRTYASLWSRLTFTPTVNTYPPVSQTRKCHVRNVIAISFSPVYWPCLSFHLRSAV